MVSKLSDGTIRRLLGDDELWATWTDSHKDNMEWEVTMVFPSLEYKPLYA